MNTEWRRNDLIDLCYAITNGQGYKSGGDADKKKQSEAQPHLTSFFNHLLITYQSRSQRPWRHLNASFLQNPMKEKSRLTITIYSLEAVSGKCWLSQMTSID